MRTIRSRLFGPSPGSELRESSSAIVPLSVETVPRLVTRGSYHMRKKGRFWVPGPGIDATTPVLVPEPAENDYVFRVSRDAFLNTKDSPIYVNAGGSTGHSSDTDYPELLVSPTEQTHSINWNSDDPINGFYQVWHSTIAANQAVTYLARQGQAAGRSRIALFAVIPADPISLGEVARARVTADLRYTVKGGDSDPPSLCMYFADGFVPSSGSSNSFTVRASSIIDVGCTMTDRGDDDARSIDGQVTSLRLQAHALFGAAGSTYKPCVLFGNRASNTGSNGQGAKMEFDAAILFDRPPAS